MAKGSKGESNSNDPKASTDSSTTLEDEETKGENRISNFSAFTFFQSIDRSPFLLKFYGLKLSHFILKHYHPCSIVNIPLSAIISNNTQRETRFICRLVICKVESFMLLPICGFVASLKDGFADSWYDLGDICNNLPAKLTQKKTKKIFPPKENWVRFVANCGFCSL